MRLGLLFCLLLPLQVNAQSKPTIERFLNEVVANAIDLRIVESNSAANLLRSETDLAKFEWSATIGAAFKSSDDPPTSPFSSEKTLTRTYSASIDKQWQSGIHTSLDYELLDNFTGFPTRADQDYFNPDLSLTIKTSLLRDIFGSRYSAIPMRVSETKLAIETESRINRKAILVGALITLAEILELEEDLKLQEALCKSVTAQKQKLQARFRRGSVQRRDYLLSQQEVNTCSVTLKNLRKRIIERTEDLVVTYKVDPKPYSQINIEAFFAEFRTLFRSPDFKPEKVDFSNNDEVIALSARHDSAKAKQLELDALTRPDLSFQVSTGLSGLQDSIGRSHKDITETNYKLFYGAVTLSFPFATKSAKINAAANRMDAEVLGFRVQKLNDEIRSRFKKLHFALTQDMASYQIYKDNVGLSERILNDAQRDFNNGRIDFFAVTEFQKSLIQSQQRLASLRRQIVIQAVEYIDFFQYFDRFGLGAPK